MGPLSTLVAATKAWTCRPGDPTECPEVIASTVLGYETRSRRLARPPARKPEVWWAQPSFHIMDGPFYNYDCQPFHIIDCHSTTMTSNNNHSSNIPASFAPA